MPRPAGWPWATLLTNVTGCALLGVLMALLAGLPRPPRPARPLLGVGVLGGFTTFSAFALDVHQLVRAHRAGSRSGAPFGVPVVDVRGERRRVAGTRRSRRSGRSRVGAGPGATGFCGALSTFWTLSYEIDRLARTGRRTLSAAYVLASFAGGLGAVSLGWLPGAAA